MYVFLHFDQVRLLGTGPGKNNFSIILEHSPVLLGLTSAKQRLLKLSYIPPRTGPNHAKNIEIQLSTHLSEHK